MSNLEKNITPYSKAIVRLLKAPVEHNSSLWKDIIDYQHEIQTYISQIGLELIIKQEEGFAFVKQFEDSEGNTLGLVQRRKIGFELSIVLVVLRQILEEFDSNPTHSATEKFISQSEIKEELELFLQEGYNKLKFQRELENYINKVVELGYLKEISKNNHESTYQIHRIIKEKVTMDILKDFKIKLQEYVKSL